MFRSILFFSITSIVCAGAGFCTYAHAETLPVATSVTIAGVNSVTEGMVVVAREAAGVYEISSMPSDAEVFGVTAQRPSLVFSQGDGEVPVVTSGIAYVQVQNTNGAIQRGDFLVTAAQPGVAMRAGDEDEHVFAIALEPFVSNDGSEKGVIQAEVGVERAKAAYALRQKAQTDTAQKTPSIIRGSIATLLVVGALFFVLYSFRAAFSQGIASVGRNPRAKRSIMTLSFANILFAVFLCAIVIFVAIAILVLPV